MSEPKTIQADLAVIKACASRITESVESLVDDTRRVNAPTCDRCGIICHIICPKCTGGVAPRLARVAPHAAAPEIGDEQPNGSEWGPVEIKARTPNTADTKLHHAHRGFACTAFEILALRAALADKGGE